MSIRYSLTRRGFLSGASAAAGGMGFALIPARAKAPMLNVQAPAFYRFKMGAFELTVVSDGPLQLGDVSGIYPGISKEEASAMLAENFIAPGNVLFEQNALVVNTGDRLVLFDTGMGTIKAFGPNSGRLLANLKAAGIDANDIDAVVLTHAHPDHCWGIMAENNAAAFPNAQIYMAKADFDFWTDESKAQGDMMTMLINGTRKSLLPNRDRIVFVTDGQEFLRGIQAMSMPGHTVGHTAYLITSEGEAICNIGDIAPHHILAVQRPSLEFAFDTDPKQAVSTRIRFFDMLAAVRILAITYHFPWPGIGHFAKYGGGFRYLPTAMKMSL